MSQRYEWDFRYTCGELATACQARLDHHRQRAAWWGEQRQDAKRALHEHGIDVREYPVTGGNRMQAVLDPDLAHRLEECQGKVQKHTQQAEDFAAFLLGFQHSGPDEVVLLHHDDILFFGLVPTEQSEE